MRKWGKHCRANKLLKICQKCKKLSIFLWEITTNLEMTEICCVVLTQLQLCKNVNKLLLTYSIFDEHLYHFEGGLVFFLLCCSSKASSAKNRCVRGLYGIRLKKSQTHFCHDAYQASQHRLNVEAYHITESIASLLSFNDFNDFRCGHYFFPELISI